MVRLGTLFSFCLIYMGSLGAYAQTCRNALTLSSSQSVIDFTTSQNQNFQVEVQRSRDTATCLFRVGFSQGQAGSYNRQLFNGPFSTYYNIYGSPSLGSPPLKDEGDQSSTAEILQGIFFFRFGSNSQNFNVYARMTPVDPFNIRPFGIYSDSLFMKLYALDISSGFTPRLESQQQVDFQYLVPKYALLSLVDSGGNYTNPPALVKNIDFGELQTGEFREMDMVLIFNAGYSVSFQSANQQRLKNSTSNSYVPYSILVGGVPQDISSGLQTQVVTGSGVSPSAPNGFPIPVRVTVGSTVGALPGNYADAITITISSIE